MRSLLILVLCFGIWPSRAVAEPPTGLSDPQATPRTQALFRNLREIAQGPTMLFGQQNANVYGIGWTGDEDRCDVRTAVGSDPAVFGYDLNVVLHGRDTDRMKPLVHDRIEEAYAQGGLITISYHMWNPASGENFYDLTPAVGKILPGGPLHADYCHTLDRVAEFLGSLAGPDGAPIPMVFRPFHEHTGSWFWWGQKLCTRDEYVGLWRFTVDYLRDHHELHHLLFAYSPSFNASARAGDDVGGHMMARYPGDAYVDVLGLDCYQNGPEVIEAVTTIGLPLLVREAERRGKIPAYTEAGIAKGLNRAWNHTYFTDLASAIQADPTGRRIAYLLTWQNRDREASYWTPCQEDDPHLADFRAFYADPFTVFLDRLPPLYE